MTNNTEEKIKKIKGSNKNSERAEIQIFSLKNEKDRNSIDELRSKKEEGKYEFTDGNWIFYPWRKTLVHVLEKKDYEKLRASRNHNLITEKEQDQFKRSRIGIAGLNVGNPAAICIALESGANEMKFADF